MPLNRFGKEIRIEALRKSGNDLLLAGSDANCKTFRMDYLFDCFNSLRSGSSAMSASGKSAE